MTDEIGSVIGIHTDIINWKEDFFLPCFVAGYEQFLPVFIGKPGLEEKAAVGIYVRKEDYMKINHSLPYVFLNYPETPSAEEFNNIITHFRKDENTNQHYHIMPNFLVEKLADKPGDTRN